MLDSVSLRKQLALLIKEHDSLLRVQNGNTAEQQQNRLKLAACESQLLDLITIPIRELDSSFLHTFATAFGLCGWQDDRKEDVLPSVGNAGGIYGCSASTNGRPDPLSYLLRKGSQKLVIQTLHILNMFRYKDGSLVNLFQPNPITFSGHERTHCFYGCVRDNENLPHHERTHIRKLFILFPTLLGMAYPGSAGFFRGPSFLTKRSYHFQLYAPWYRTLLSILFAVFVAVLMFSPLGPMVLGPALIGVVVWVGASGATIFAGAVVAAVSGFVAATFDYVLAATLWFISEVIIGLFSLPTALFSEITSIGFTYAAAVPLILFALPTFLLGTLVEIAEYISGTAWIHQRVMTIRNFFTKEETTKANTDDFKFRPLREVGGLAISFDNLAHNEVTYFGNVSKRSFQENPDHKRSSVPTITVEDLAPSKSI